MNQPTDRTAAGVPERARTGGAASTCAELCDAPPRAPYATPKLERLGAWSALTLQQSVPIFP